MNIAILLLGRQQWFDLTNETYQRNIIPALKGHNVQYFAHFWDCPSCVVNDPACVAVDHLNYQQNGLAKFKEIYKPLTIKTELQKSKYEMLSFFNMKENINHLSFLSQTYSFYQSFTLVEEYQKKHNIVFDLFIKMRGDLAFLNKMNINFDSNSIYVKDVGNFRPTSNYVHDFMFITKNYNNIKIISNLGFAFDNILKHPEQFVYEDRANDSICPEEILAIHVRNNKIPVKQFNFNIDLARHLNYSFSRSDIK